MSERVALEPYIGQTIEIEATLTSRADATGVCYGFLLTDVTTPRGRKLTDHAWLQTHSLDLAAVSGYTIRAWANIVTYDKAGRVDGEYTECAETGTGIAGLCDVRSSSGAGGYPWMTRLTSCELAGRRR